VAQVYTPKDFQLNRIMLDLVALADPAPVAAEWAQLRRTGHCG
jgi:(2R)-ethylmalonyl-CoA mutase